MMTIRLNLVPIVKGVFFLITYYTLGTTRERGEAVSEQEVIEVVAYQVLPPACAAEQGIVTGEVRFIEPSDAVSLKWRNQ
jgi:hypothetical protein